MYLKSWSSICGYDIYLESIQLYFSNQLFLNIVVTTQLQHKTKLGWPHNWVEPTPPHHHPTPPPPHPTTQTFKALPGNPGSWFSVCNLILTQLDELWKTTSIFLKMEDDLNFFQMEDDLNFVLGNLGSWFLVCNIVSTQLNEIWKTT